MAAGVMGLPWVFDDGGRAAAGYKGSTGDCVCRGIAIVTGLEYQTVYDLIIEYAARERPSSRKARSHPRTGVHKATIRRIMADLGWEWVPTMQIGSGTTVHVRPGELPESGRYLLNLSRHNCALVDGVIRDNHDPSRDGTRAVYGFWRLPDTP
jgi:hypothetical protein